MKFIFEIVEIDQTTYENLDVHRYDWNSIPYKHIEPNIRVDRTLSFYVAGIRELVKQLTEAHGVPLGTIEMVNCGAPIFIRFSSSRGFFNTRTEIRDVMAVPSHLSIVTS